MTQPDNDGNGSREAMRLAVASAGLALDELELAGDGLVVVALAPRFARRELFRLGGAPDDGVVGALRAGDVDRVHLGVLAEQVGEPRGPGALCSDAQPGR